MTLSNEDQLRHLVAQLQRELKVDLKNGATKFELLLNTVGLGGAVDSRVKRSIFETQQIRNLLAHRAGFIDKRFMDSCPWMGLNVGDQLRVDHDMYRNSLAGLYVYVMTVLNRCLVSKGRAVAAYTCPPQFEGALTFD